VRASRTIGSVPQDEGGCGAFLVFFFFSFVFFFFFWFFFFFFFLSFCFFFFFSCFFFSGWIVHGALTIRAACKYAARLRLPEDAATRDVEAAVARVLAEVDLEEHADTRVDASQADSARGQASRSR